MRSSVGPYRIVDQIGRGGMGVVYVAEDPRLGRRVAIKTLGEVRDGEARERLWREARAAASLNHPGICQVFDVGEERKGELWVAMELLEGDSLEKRLEGGPARPAEAVEIVRGILAPLGYLHRRGFVHRDVKPSNVFLTPHGVKLLDFGLARPIADSDDARLTRTGAIVGSPRYMAPEQWRGEEVGPRADLFACGAILFEMLTGRQAFPGKSAIEVFRAVALDEAPRLADGAGGDPILEALDPVVSRALAREPGARFGSAAEMSRALDTAIRDLGARIAESEAAAPSGRSRSGARASRDDPPQRFIALPFRLLRPDPEIDFLSSSLPEAIGSSLSGLEHLIVRSSRLATGAQGEDGDLKRLAAEAEVDLVLAGTLMRAGERVRLAAQLVRVPAGTVIWSVTEQAPLGDLFDLQDDLTRRVVESLSVPLSARDRRRLRRDVPSTARAYELYLRALDVGVSTVTGSAARAARDLYRSCLEEDPEFAPAWARYARSCRVIAKYRLDDADEHWRLAGEAFERAFELDPDSPLAHNLYTYFQLEELGDSIGAMRRLLARLRERTTDADVYA
ncbi:MAG: protein kinase domain-containing protein, partial [Gemmatimonadota bacterium]